MPLNIFSPNKIFNITFHFIFLVIYPSIPAHYFSSRTLMHQSTNIYFCCSECSIATPHVTGDMTNSSEQTYLKSITIRIFEVKCLFLKNWDTLLKRGKNAVYMEMILWNNTIMVDCNQMWILPFLPIEGYFKLHSWFNIFKIYLNNLECFQTAVKFTKSKLIAFWRLNFLSTHGRSPSEGSEADRFTHRNPPCSPNRVMECNQRLLHVSVMLPGLSSVSCFSSLLSVTPLPGLGFC